MKNLFAGALGGTRQKKLTVLSIFLVAVFLFVPVHSADAAVLDWLKDFLDGWPASILNWLLRLILYCASSAVRLAAWLVDFMLQPELYTAVLGDGIAIQVGWTTIRDFCNMFYIFFLLLIAFATIARWNQYSAKNLLPKIILSIFLINFSGTITKVVIDFGQAFLFGFAAWMGSFSGTTGKGAGLTSIVDYFYYQLSLADGSDSGTMILFVFAIAYTSALALAYFVMALALLLRLVMFVFLITVSPAAFFCLSIPNLSHIWRQWSQSLLKNTISGPVFIFFIYISAVMATDVMNFTKYPAMGANMSFMSGVAQVLARNMIALAMLWMAFPAASSIGGAGAKSLMGQFTSVQGAAMYYYNNFKVGRRAVGKVTGRAHAELKQRSEGYRNLTQKVNSGLERSYIGGGAYLKHEADNSAKIRTDVEKHQSIMKTMTTEQMAAYANSFKLNVEQGARAKQAMIQELANKGKLTNEDLMKAGYKTKDGQVDRAAFQKDMNQVRSWGGDDSEVYKQRMDLAADPKDIEKEINKAVDKGEFNKIKLDVMLDPAARQHIENLVPLEQRSKWMAGKAQGERTSYLSQREAMLATGWEKSGINDAEKNAFQAESYALASAQDKPMRMATIKGAKGGRIQYDYVDTKVKDPKTGVEKTVREYRTDSGTFKSLADNFTKSDVLGLRENTLKEHGHLLSKNNITQLGQGGTKVQQEAVKKSLEDKATPDIQRIARHGGSKSSDDTIKKEYNTLSDDERVLCDKLTSVNNLT